MSELHQVHQYMDYIRLTETGNLTTHYIDSSSCLINTMSALIIMSRCLSISVQSTFKIMSLKWGKVFLEIIFGPMVKRLLSYLHWWSSWTRLKHNELRSSDVRVFSVDTPPKFQTVRLPFADRERRYCMNQALKLQAVHNTHYQI